MRVSTHVLATAFAALTLFTTACDNSAPPTAVPEGAAAVGALGALTVGSTPSTIVNRRGSNMCADVYEVSMQDGAPVVVWDCNGGINQKFTWQENGTVTVYGTKCLTATNRGRDGDQVTISSCIGSAAQKWSLTEAGEIQGVKGKCLSLENGSATAGSHVEIDSCDGSSGQKWNVSAAGGAPTTPDTSATPTTPDTSVTPPPTGEDPPTVPDTTTPTPTPPPSGAYVSIVPGQSIQSAVDAKPTGTQFLIKAGVHRRQSISPKSGDVFVGETGAVLDGENASQYAFTTSSASNVTIRGLKITNYASGITGGTIHADNSVSWVVSDNEISYGAGVGIRMGRGMKVLRNNIHHNKHSGIDGTKSDNALVEGNTIANNATAHGDVDGVNGDAAGMKIFRTRGVITRNNVVKDNWGPGVWYDIDNFDALIEGNTITGNTHRGIFYEVSYNGVIRNNLIQNNGYGVSASWISNSGIFVVSSGDVEIYGNTVQGNRQGITAVQTSRGSGAAGEYLLKNLYVHDNKVTMAEGITGVDEAVGSDAVFDRNIRFVHNSYTLGGNSTYFMWRYSKLDANGWKAQGQDVTGTFSR